MSLCVDMQPCQGRYRDRSRLSVYHFLTGPPILAAKHMGNQPDCKYRLQRHIQSPIYQSLGLLLFALSSTHQVQNTKVLNTKVLVILAFQFCQTMQ